MLCRTRASQDSYRERQGETHLCRRPISRAAEAMFCSDDDTMSLRLAYDALTARGRRDFHDQARSGQVKTFWERITGQCTCDPPRMRGPGGAPGLEARLLWTALDTVDQGAHDCSHGTPGWAHQHRQQIRPMMLPHNQRGEKRGAPTQRDSSPISSLSHPMSGAAPTCRSGLATRQTDGRTDALSTHASVSKAPASQAERYAHTQRRRQETDGQCQRGTITTTTITRRHPTSRPTIKALGHFPLLSCTQCPTQAHLHDEDDDDSCTAVKKTNKNHTRRHTTSRNKTRRNSPSTPASVPQRSPPLYTRLTKASITHWYADNACNIFCSCPHPLLPSLSIRRFPWLCHQFSQH